MTSSDQRLSKPRGYGAFTRIVFVHQVFALVILGSGLSASLAAGHSWQVLLTVLGLVIAVATVGAMFGVTRWKSMPALSWLRLLLWAAVVRGLLSMSLLSDVSHAAMQRYAHSLIINQIIITPLALYWSKAVQGRYLASLRSS